MLLDSFNKSITALNQANADLKELEGDDDAALVLKSQKIVGLMTVL